MHLPDELKGFYNNIPPRATLLVGLSGGADSVALLTLTKKLAGNRQIIALHLNHQLRGDDSNEDEKYCRQLCTELSIKLVCHKQDIAALSANDNLENTARSARREFFFSCAKNYPQPHLLLAHHRSDQIETILMRLLRGSGWRGLSGIKANSQISHPDLLPVPLFRPLLNIRRAELLKFLKQNNLHWREDKSNQDISILRNRLRHVILPALRLAFKDTDASLLKLSETANDVDNHINLLAGAISASAEYGGVFFKTAAFDKQPQQVCIRAIENHLQTHLHAPRLRGRDYTTITEVITGKKNNATLATGHILRTEQDGYFLRACFSGNNVTTHQQHFFSEIPFHYEGEFATLSATPHKITPGKIPDTGDPYTEYLNPNTLLPPLCIRKPDIGERFSPAGLNGSKKVSDILADLKVPRRIRENILLLADNEGIIWLPPYKVAQRALLSEFATDAIKVVFSHK